MTNTLKVKKNNQNKSEQQRLKESETVGQADKVNIHKLSNDKKLNKKLLLDTWDNADTITVNGEAFNAYELMLPEQFQLNEGSQVIDSELQRKINSLFIGNKFADQKRNMEMYFEDGLTEEEIARLTGAKKCNVNRSINSGVKKIYKKLSTEEWNKVKWIYNVSIIGVN
ncbi:hypothetical protein BGM25_06255 [Bacillus sp. FJAT-29953]|nr:hypothetical protein [Bacillus sp. FJAT-29953]